MDRVHSVHGHWPEPNKKAASYIDTTTIEVIY